MGENITFWQDLPIQVNGRSTVALVTQLPMLEGRGSRNLFNIVNSVNSLKEYCLPLSVFMGEEHHLFAKSPHSSELKDHCSSCKRIFNV
jgi:hypothetical protein